MKTIFRKLLLAVVAIGFVALQSCEKHTCPTYSKANTTQAEQKV